MDTRGDVGGAVVGHLELRQGYEGAQYYLDGRPIAKGDPIEMLLVDGRWLRGRFEWNGVAVVWPALRVELAGSLGWRSGHKLTGAMPIPPAAVVRRPRAR